MTHKPVPPGTGPDSATRSSVSAGVRPASWRFIVAAALGVMALVTGINLSFRFDNGLYDAVYHGTSHLVTPTLIGAGLLTAAVIVGLVLGGKLSFRDFGWKWEFLVPGLAATAVIWIVMQLIEVIAQLGSNGQLALSPSWSRLGATTVIGVLLGQTFGTAAGEETFFRGFLVPQLHLRFAHMRAPMAIGAAIGLSQAVFSLYHLPNLILGNSGLGTGPLDVVSQLGLDFAIGVVFASLYVRTGNIFLVMGIHALQNAGTSVVATPIQPAAVMLALAVVVLLATFVPGFVNRLRRVSVGPQAPKSKVSGQLSTR